MMIVDTHSHAGINWFEPVEMILYQMDQNDVSKTMLIQHAANYHNRYIIESTKRFPGRFGAVIWVDVEKPDAPETLERLSKEEGVVGVRLHPTDRSPGPDPLAIWRKATELGITVSCYARSAEHTSDPEFQKIIEELPNMTLVLEHLAGAYRPQSPESVTAPYEWYQSALTLARFPNTYIKFGGLGEFCIRPAKLEAQFQFEEVPPLMDLAYDAFGPKRMMYGSDYPPVGRREGYRNSLQGVLELAIWKNQDEKDWAFGKAAVEAFKLG